MKRKKRQKSFREFCGKVQLTRDGSAYIIVDGDEEDIFVKTSRTRHALNGDRVIVAMTREKSGGKHREGEVVKILERSRIPFVGIFHTVGAQAWVLMQSKTMPYDIEVDLEEALSMGAERGMKVAARVERWDRGDRSPVGHVVDVLGEPGRNETEMHAILAEFNLPYRFEKEVENAADSISEKIGPEELKGRKDFRRDFTFTIDPADAKDFDDALSFRPMKNGNFEIGVHIADVSHYVKPGTAIDREAYERGTSVYLVDRTIPMLPEKLCNGVCSLRPHEDKLCFSVVMEVNAQAEVLKAWFGKSVINSDERYSYEEAQAVIDSNDPRAGSSNKVTGEAILELHKLATILRNQRYKDGAINFESQEVKFQLDENAKPIGIYIKESKEANWLIEEFMLLANKKVAEKVGKAKEGTKGHKTFVYRVHDEPNPEKLNTFVEFVAKLGFKMKVSSRQALAHSYNSLFETIAGRGEEYMIDNIAIRTMSKAFYSTENIGHYGLGFPFYTHFTSPIRRYPDLMVHRLLEHYLEGGPSANAEAYEEYCKHCSLMEKRAADAERASVKYKQAEYLSDKLGQTFPALISGVSEWGLYAEIEGCKCEGMIPIGSLQGDYYMLDEDNYQVIGRRYGHRYKLGDPVQIRVKGVDMLKKLIDFELVDEERLMVDTILDVSPRSKKQERHDRQSKPARKEAKGRDKATPKGRKTKVITTN